MAPRNVRMGQGLRARLIGTASLPFYAEKNTFRPNNLAPEPPVVLTALGFSSTGPFPHATAAGSTLANITNLQGASITISPDDGVLVISEDQTKILRGLAAWSAGAGSYSIIKTHSNATNSPLSTTYDFTVAAPEGNLVSSPYISGIQTQGQVLTKNNAVWDPVPTSIATTWYFSTDPDVDEDGSNVGTGDTFTPTADHTGGYFRLGQVGTFAGGGTAETFSQWIGPIAAPVSISGVPSSESITGSTYFFAPTLAGGREPYVVTNIGTALPAGWSLNSTTGAVSCDDVQTNVSNVQLRLTDADGLTATLAAFSILRALPPKWYNFSFRQTAAGSNTWNGGGINLGTDVDPNNDENVTSLLIQGADGWPLTTADGEEQYGRTIAGAGTYSNNTAVLSGNDVLLGGYAVASSRPGFSFTVPGPGEYDLRLAGGAAQTASTEDYAIFDGLHNGHLNAVITTQPRLWTPSTAVTVNSIYMGTDGSVWKTPSAGTTGTVMPTGAGPTFVDNDITWNRLSVTALFMINRSPSVVGQVIDQNGDSVTTTNWRSQTPRTVTVSGSWGMGLTLYVLTGSGRLRQVGIKAKGAVLGDISVITGFGENQGQSPTMYANEPQGFTNHKIVPSGGKNSVSAYSLSGTLAPYFTLQAMNGYVWLTNNGTRIPDSLAGPQILKVTQTDSNSSGSPHETTLTCNIVSSQDRPTDSSINGRITTESWLARKKVKDVTDTTWTGYAGQAFVTDTLVNGTASFEAALDAFTTTPPNGTGWYRIRLGAGTYTGKRGTTLALDFGTGGLLIEPAAGQDPEFDYGFESLQVHGWHMRNVKMPNNKLKMGVTYAHRWPDPGPAGINGGGRFSKVVYENNRIGCAYGAGNNADTDYSTKYSYFLYMEHGESALLKDNSFDGNHVPWFLYGVRKQKYTGNTYKRVASDLYGPGQSDDRFSTINVFADNDVYLWFDDEVEPQALDPVGYSSGTHLDALQIRTWNQNLTNWNAFAKPDNMSISDPKYPFWKVGDMCFNNEPGIAAVWRVKSITKADALTGAWPGPNGYADFVDGDITWEWVCDYVWGNDMHIWMENCTYQSASPNSGVAARQFFINSNGRHRSAANFGAVNVAYGSYSGYGVGQTDGDTRVEFCTLVGPSDLHPSVSPITSAVFNRGKGKVFTAHTMVQRTAYVEDEATKHVLDEVVVSFAASAAVGRRPGDLLAGPFSQQSGTNRWIYPTLPNDGSLSRAAFVEAMRDILIAKSGTAGIQS